MLNFRPHKLYVKSITGGGTNENGDPIPVTEEWGDPIPCHISAEGRELIYRYPDGTATVFSYAVWIDPIPEDLTSKFVRIEDQYGHTVEKQVQKCINRQLRTKLFL